MTNDLLFIFGGPSGRRCSRCGNPVPDGFAPAERLDGSLELHCPPCDRAKVEERASFIRKRMNLATPADFPQSAAERWRKAL